MVAARLSREDAKQKGWLLDGYPRSLSQAQSLEKMQIRPDVYIVLNVCQTFILFYFFPFPETSAAKLAVVYMIALKNGCQFQGFWGLANHN